MIGRSRQPALLKDLQPASQRAVEWSSGQPSAPHVERPLGALSSLASAACSLRGVRRPRPRRPPGDQSCRPGAPLPSPQSCTARLVEESVAVEATGRELPAVGIERYAAPSRAMLLAVFDEGACSRPFAQKPRASSHAHGDEAESVVELGDVDVLRAAAPCARHNIAPASRSAMVVRSSHWSQEGRPWIAEPTEPRRRSGGSAAGLFAASDGRDDHRRGAVHGSVAVEEAEGIDEIMRAFR